MGKKLGWIISGVILLIVILVAGIMLYQKLGLSGSVGDPTFETTAAGALEPITMDFDLTPLVPVPAGSGAEKMYAEAVQEALKVTADPIDFADKAKKAIDPLKNPQYKSIVEKIVQASEMGMDAKHELLFSELKVRAATDVPTQELLKGISRLVGNTGLQYVKEGKTQDAVKTYNAQVIFGYRLWKNGVYRAARHAGQGALGEGLGGLALTYKEAKDTPKMELAKELSEKKTALSRKWVKKEQITQRLNECLIGDLGNLALNDKDRTWRIQGAMWLGVAQWTSAGGNQRKAIQNFLKNHAKNSKDPLFAQACKDALAISREDIQRFPVVF